MSNAQDDDIEIIFPDDEVILSRKDCAISVLGDDCEIDGGGIDYIYAKKGDVLLEIFLDEAERMSREGKTSILDVARELNIDYIVFSDYYAAAVIDRKTAEEIRKILSEEP